MTDSPEKAPLFPSLLFLPLAAIPVRVHSAAVVTILNRVFSGALRDGELDYLKGRTVRIHVQDVRLTFCMTLREGRLVASSTINMPDLSITGNLHAYPAACCTV